MSELNSRNLLVFTTVSSIFAIVLGFIGPFYVLQVQKLSGGVEKLGLAFSIMVLAQAATTYFVGHFSDKLGRRPFLFITAYTDSAILFFYTVITEPYQLYILQILLGVTNGMADTVSTSFLGDLTVKSDRGRNVGKYNAIVGFSAGIGLFFGGYLVKFYGLKTLFYLASAVMAIASTLIFLIKEKENGNNTFKRPV